MKSCFLICILLVSNFIYGQNPGIKLSGLLKKVAVNYPTIKAKEAQINAAKYSIDAVRKDYLPDLIVADQYQYSTNNGLEGSYYSNEGTSISTSGGIRSQDIYQPVFGSFTTIMINWHAFDFGKVKQSIRVAQSKLQLAKAAYDNEVFRLQVKVADAYLLYLLSVKLVSVQENNLKRTLAFQQFVLSHTKSGLMPGVDSSSANAEVASAQLALLQSRQFVLQQKNNLEQLSLTPVDSISIDTTAFLQKIPDYILTPSTISSHPSLLLAHQQLNEQYTELTALKKSVLPTINLIGAGWARGSGVNRSTKEYLTGINDGIPYQTYNYLAGVAVKWNITSLAKNKQQYLGGIQNLEAERFTIEEQESELSREVKNAELQFESSIEQSKVTPVQYKAALDAFNLSNARYQAGLASLNEVLQAYYILSRADVDQAVSINNVWRSILQHAASTGNITEFTNLLPR
jgi:outer membrane protein TolC